MESKPTGSGRTATSQSQPPASLPETKPGPDLGLLSPEQVSRLTGIAVATLDTWRCRRRGPPFIKLGRIIWYRLRDLEMWIELNRRETSNDIAQSGRQIGRASCRERV